MTREECINFQKQNPHHDVFWATAFQLNPNDPIRKLQRNMVPTPVRLERGTFWKIGRNGQKLSSTVSVGYGVHAFPHKADAVEWYVDAVEAGRVVIADRVQVRIQELNTLTETARALALRG